MYLRFKYYVLSTYTIVFLSDIMLSDISQMPTVKYGDRILELEMNPPSPEFQEIAKKELRETPEVQKESIARLRELLKGEALSNENTVK